MRLDRDSKQPIWLGLVLIFAAFIFTLFFITRVHASDFSAYDYNNILLVQFTGSTIEFCFSDGSYGFRRNIGYEYTDGVPVITQEELESKLDGIFAYILPSETIALFFDNYAAAGPYLNTKTYFLQRGCAVMDYTGSFPLDSSGFYLSKVNAGTWFIPYYTRSVSLTPTPSPSPTPEPDHYGYIFKVDSFYWCIQFDASGFNKEVEAALTSTVSAVLSDNNSTDRIWSKSNLILENFDGSTSSWQGWVTALTFTASSVSNVYAYNLGSSLVSTDLDFISDNYSGVSISSSNSASAGFVTLFNNSNGVLYNGISQSLDFYSLTVKMSSGSSSSVPSLIYTNIPELLVYPYSTANTTGSYIWYCTLYDSSNSVNLPYKAFELGLSLTQADIVNPIPSPTPSPEPMPTSSESIHVILPTGTPTPTPPFSVPAEDPGVGGSGSPGGSSQGSLTPGQVNSTLNTFKQYTQNNGAFAFLYACTGLIPDDALYFLFILLFILLLLACLRLFVHFTGG